MGDRVTRDIRYHKASPSHLHPVSVDKQLLPKKAYTLQSCAPSALSLRSFSTLAPPPRESGAALTLPSAGGSRGLLAPLTPGPTSQLEFLSPTDGSSPRQQLQNR